MTGKSAAYLFLVFGVAARALFAVSYVVPTDRFEIERSSAIIVGRALSSHVERSAQFGIETVTDVVLEEGLKGEVGTVVQIHEPGGVLGDEARLIPGVPAFIDGDRVLLFLYQRDNGDYVVNDLQLGSFHFAKDLVVRDDSELNGWDLDGTVHRERHRAAEAFINYIRGVVRGEAVVEDYFVPTIPHAGATAALPPAVNAVFTATSYTVNLSGGLGARWNVFPSTVNWNQGSSEVGALGNGTSQINAAFNAWNGGGAHYVLASASPNTKGIMDALDGVNNVVFEKNLTSAGVQPYNCASGGIFGMGGMHSALFGAGTHVFHGETFGTTMEVDVSMNQGLGACSLAQLPSEAFNSTVTHEVGHTLGFRHSDQNRTQNAPCSSDPSLDCSNSAIMDHLLLPGLNGKLQPWDSSAVSNLYGVGPACTPPSITVQPSGSTITSGNLAQLSVTATGTPTLTYQWFVGSSGNTSAPVIGGNTASILVGPAVTTAYWVRVTGQCAPAADSSAVTVTVNPASCPTVVLGTPQATATSGGFQLSINASGGSSFGYQWFQGASSGVGSQIGTGNPLLVSPPQTASYWCRVTNNCGNTADSAIVTAMIVACSAPQIIDQPQDQQAVAGTTVTLTIGLIGTTSSVSWFQGARGDTSTPVGSGQTIVSPVLTQTTQFWARITNSCGSVDSDAATIAVRLARRRAARHGS
jgi:hypothetical protein